MNVGIYHNYGEGIPPKLFVSLGSQSQVPKKLDWINRTRKVSPTGTRNFAMSIRWIHSSSVQNFQLTMISSLPPCVEFQVFMMMMLKSSIALLLAPIVVCDAKLPPLNAVTLRETKQLAAEIVSPTMLRGGRQLSGCEELWTVKVEGLSDKESYLTISLMADDQEPETIDVLVNNN